MTDFEKTFCWIVVLTPTILAILAACGIFNLKGF